MKKICKNCINYRRGVCKDYLSEHLNKKVEKDFVCKYCWTKAEADLADTKMFIKNMCGGD